MPPITSIEIPSTVTFIGEGAIACESLETITFKSTTPPTLGGDLGGYDGLPANCVIRVPQGSLPAYTEDQSYPDPDEYTYVGY